jgi:hypothetical protein
MEHFWLGFEKRAGGLETAAELTGLGMLAVPSIQEMRNKHMKERTKSKLEVGGLGILAAPYLHHVYQSGIEKMRKPKSLLGRLAKNIKNIHK